MTGAKGTGDRTIDFSRYRVAEAIAEQYAAGDSAVSIGETYELAETSVGQRYIVELIVAAHDRKGRFEPQGPTGDQGERCPHEYVSFDPTCDDCGLPVYRSDDDTRWVDSEAENPERTDDGEG